MTEQHALNRIASLVIPGATLRNTRRLTGGVSADVHALELETADGSRRSVVVRQLGDVAGKTRGSDAIAMEFELLKALYQAGLPVPEPLLLDTSARYLAEPFLVMAFVDGSSEIPAAHASPYLEIMADTLVRVHALPHGSLPTLPSRMDPLPELFEFLPAIDGLDELRAHLTERSDTACAAAPVLLHGDFWPGNLLWQNVRVAAILDWEDAALGDPLADVAGSRLELLWKLGPAAAEHFTRAYAARRHIDPHRLALWEIYVGAAAACFMGTWGLEPAHEADMRHKAEGFVKTAAERVR